MLRALTAFASVALSIGLGFAQVNTGSLSGTVLDASGAAVPNARITLRNQNTGVENPTSTSDAGLFRFPFVNPGTYNI